MPTMKEIYWLAGLLEGEGCFHAYRQGRKKTPNPLVQVQVAMTDKDVVERIAGIM